MEQDADTETSSGGLLPIDQCHMYINHKSMRLSASTHQTSEVPARDSLSGLRETLVETPWALCSAAEITGSSRSSVWDAVRIVADQFGPRVIGREGRTEEEIEPLESMRAHPRSASATSGLSELPLHVELSHRTKPCRYVILGCLRVGKGRTATRLVDRRDVAFSADELALLQSAPVFVRTGRNSFYATILPRTSDYLRYDPNCMEAVDKRGLAALDTVKRRLAETPEQQMNWNEGQILVIDNWRALHGRAASQVASGRCLARVMIDG